jgi:hypothetical protein
MPLVDFNDPALWDGGPQSLYRSYIDDVAVGFCRATKEHHYHGEIADIMFALEAKGLTKEHRILIVGAAFGWFAEGLIDLGYLESNIVNADTSTWIHANKADNAVLDILNADPTTSEGQDAVVGELGGEPDWIISEDVLPALSDEEAITFCNALHAFAGGGVVHWVSVRKVSQDARLNWKTLEEWKALVTPDLVIERGTARVL